MPDLRGKAAVVTGASSGLGAAIALALAEHGADVVMTARGADRLAASANAVELATGRTPLACVGDISRADDVAVLKAATEAQFGQTSILVNSAGIFGPLSTIADSEIDSWVETLHTNTVGPYLTCRAFVGGMLAAGWGRIVNVSSAASLAAPESLMSAYATSKVALNQLTRHLASEVEGTGVTANVIHPGSLKTEMYVDIQAKIAGQLGQSQALEAWVELVGSTGGDSLSAATDLILALIGDEVGAINGEFRWPAGSLETHLPSW